MVILWRYAPKTDWLRKLRQKSLIAGIVGLKHFSGVFTSKIAFRALKLNPPNAGIMELLRLPLSKSTLPAFSRSGIPPKAVLHHKCTHFWMHRWPLPWDNFMKNTRPNFENPSFCKETGPQALLMHHKRYRMCLLKFLERSYEFSCRSSHIL